MTVVCCRLFTRNAKAAMGVNGQQLVAIDAPSLRADIRCRENAR